MSRGFNEYGALGFFGASGDGASKGSNRCFERIELEKFAFILIGRGSESILFDVLADRMGKKCPSLLVDLQYTYITALQACLMFAAILLEISQQFLQHFPQLCKSTSRVCNYSIILI